MMFRVDYTSPDYTIYNNINRKLAAGPDSVLHTVYTYNCLRPYNGEW